MPSLIPSTTNHVTNSAPRSRVGSAGLPAERCPGSGARIRRLVLLSVAIAGITACSTRAPAMQVFSQAALPDVVKVPSGHHVALETAASGDITYECRAKKDMAGQYEWVFVGPDAGLRDRKGARVGKYFGPPATWQSDDGSRITGAQLAVASTGAADIPLQLVKANAATGPGLMQGVTYIQRVNTRGGVAPAQACSAALTGQKQVVPYAADYVFWRAL